MAVDARTAFGRYIRNLRERRKLSLDDVQSLSRGSAEAINKGYLSRCENGHQSVAFSKVITLSRIYEIPVEVFAERLELDMELDRVGSPETDGRTLQELTALGKQAYRRGAVWDLYAYYRDAMLVSLQSEVDGSFSTAAEQHLVMCMHTCSAAMKIGRSRYPLHELEYIIDHPALTDRFRFLVFDRLARAHRDLRNYRASREFSEKAIQHAEGIDSEYLHVLYSNRGRLAAEEGDLNLASEYYLKSYRAAKKIGEFHACAVELLQLGYLYKSSGRVGAARRAAIAAENIARDNGIDRSLGFALALRGHVELAEGNPGTAAECWREAAELAKRHNDRILRFKVDLFRYQNAKEEGKEAAARAIERRLKRLAPWLPEEGDEITLFKDLLEAQGDSETGFPSRNITESGSQPNTPAELEDDGQSQ